MSVLLIIVVAVACSGVALLVWMFRRDDSRLGMIALARRSGRPVYAIATATSRRKILERVWDKMQLNFPFSTIGFACEGPFYMTDAAVSDEAYAAELSKSLDRVLQKAFDLADGKVKPGE